MTLLQQRGNNGLQGFSSLTSSIPKSHRETGIVTKTMGSYGFISCCERNESIFFHFSQYNGDPNEIQPGDEVEFEVTTDSSKGKLIARRVVCLPPGTVSFESLSEERLLGKVEQEPLLVRNYSAFGGRRASTSQDEPDLGIGRIVYEAKGEFFFVSYGFTDINDDRDIRTGDEVSFYMAQNKRTGALSARLVRLVQEAKVNKTRGIIKSLKDSFGFIERADIVQDIFFHYSEVDQGEDTKLILGASVEFVIQNRQGKHVACQIKVLPHGTVSFDVIGEDQFEGVVKAPVIRSFTHGRGKVCEASEGKIIYDPVIGSSVLSYTERDQKGSYTMCVGDLVSFRIATDRRDGSTRATKVSLIKLVEEQNKTRERGIIAALRDGFGFIRCAKRDCRMFFHVNEVIDSEAQLNTNTEVEFTVQSDYTNEREHAVRIALLPALTVQFEIIHKELLTGTVKEELPTDTSRNRPSVLRIQNESPCGLLEYNDKEEFIPFYWSTESVQFGDKVQFQIANRSYDGLVYAVNIKILHKGHSLRFKGVVSVLKEGFGFIETEEHDCEIFFPFSSCNKYCDPKDLKLLDEVEFGLVKKNGRLSADEIRKLEPGSVRRETVQPEAYEGVIVRPMKSSDSSDEYEGLIRPLLDISLVGGECIPYSFTSISDHKILLQAGETVNFQLGYNEVSGSYRALNITNKKELMRGIVERIKDQFGFINYKDDNGETISVFFHRNSMSDGCEFSELSSGDEVQFKTMFSQRSQKDSAIYVKKITTPQVRPERLRHGSTKGSSTLVSVIRHPKGPDGSIGFM